MRKQKQVRKPSKIIGAFDTETTNIDDGFGNYTAYTHLYQVGELTGDLISVTPENVETCVNVEMFRDAKQTFVRMLEIAEKYAENYTPVICVHNLGFDMHALARELLSVAVGSVSIKVLAKTPQKPITIGLCVDNVPFLVLWDTLGFSMNSLEKMGLECGYSKAVGEWDYSLIRAPQTELTEHEQLYAKRDIYALIAWLGFFLRTNPEITEDVLAYRACTKTGTVRVKREALLHDLKGVENDKTAGEMWKLLNRSQKLNDDDMLFTVQACTRGGFTFTASKHAGKVYEHVFAFDAKSQHPAQMVSHLYPVNFKSANSDALMHAFNATTHISIKDILNCWHCPFPVAFCGRFDFLNLRPKNGTCYQKHGIYPLAYARFKSGVIREMRDNEADEVRRVLGYCDTVDGKSERAFGKLISGETVTLYLTELAAWEVAQAYEWDYVHAVDGYMTMQYVKPSDYSVLSVLEFYKKKDVLKHVIQAYDQGEYIKAAELAAGALPEYLIEHMKNGDDVTQELHSCYMSAKADLNGIFGIEATNEAKRDMVLTNDGIEYTGVEGAENLPNQVKAWYQFGQRIVGWSRIAQHIVINRLSKISEAIINGDTDSVKCAGLDEEKAAEFLAEYGAAVDAGKTRVMERVKTNYTQKYNELEHIGYYELEAIYEQMYAAWNKSYCTIKHGLIEITLAGVPSNKRSENKHDSLEDYAQVLLNMHGDLAVVCGIVFGYNTILSHDITKLKIRSIPRFAGTWTGTVKDWRGDSYTVVAPRAVGLAPLDKIIGGTDNYDNYINMLYTKENNPYLQTNVRLLCWSGDLPCVLNM